MKKYFLIVLMSLMATMLWAQVDAIKVSKTVESPENLYLLKNGTGLMMTPYTSPTETKANAGLFAFFRGSGGRYYIYNVDNKKWLSYESAKSYSVGTNKVVLVDNQADAQTWRSQKFKISGVTHFQFEPMTSTNATGGVYMNWYGDVDKNPLDNQTITVGFWSSDGNNDVGSRWVLEVPEFNTYTVVAETGNVTIHGETYDNGETISVLGELSQGEVVAAKQEGKFAVVNIDHAAKTITVTYLDMPELRESAPYTQAWVYPKQQDAVGEAQTEIEGNVYTLYNNVLAASFMKVDKSVYFLGSKAMNLEAGSDLFIVGFGDGESVAASQMELKSFEAKELSANENAIGGAEHFAGKALEAVFGYTYANEEIEIVWRAVLRDGSHYLRTEMELTGKGNVDMYDVIAMNYNVDTKAAGSKPVALGNTRGKVIMNNRIFAGLETPTAYNTAGDATNENDNWTMVVAPSTDNLEVASWTAMDIAEVPMRVQEVAGSDKTYYTYTKNVELKKNQKVVVTVSYKSGAKRFDLDGTDLLDQNGSVVVSDYHHGFTGTSKENNSFSMIAPNDGTFTLRTFCDNREGDLVSSCEYKVEVFEAKTEDAVTSEIVNMQGRWSRNVVLKAGETWKVAAVVGLIAQDGTQDEADVRKTQKRRSFLAYSERERAVPWRAFPCYISWYELNINRNNAPAGEEHTNMQIGPVMDVLKVWKEKMYDKYGVGPASFIIDDGWDNYGTWTFHSAFPNEMKDMAAYAADMGAGVGAWLGPVGGYGQSGTYRRNYWTGKGGMQLSNPDYYATFLAAAENLVKNQHVDGKGVFNFFKFDGISAQFSATGPDNGDNGNENAEGIIRLEQYVRENLKEDIFFNTTVGTWASPFWYQVTDATWRQENDHGEVGDNSVNRENWITYRDNLVHQNYVTNSPICPINTLMTHGFILSKYGPPASNSRDYKTVLNELRCAFACGSGLVELYNDYDLMNSINGGKLWEDLADLIKWQKDNADVLMDAHWVGGDPWTGSKAEVYGWASWNGEKATLALRNGSNNAQTFTTTLRQVFEIPANITGSIKLSKAFIDQANLQGITNGEAINIDEELKLRLAGSSVYMFNGKMSESNTTGIESMVEEKVQVGTSVSYDLNGRRVVNPTKGLYIINGQKQIVR